MLAWQELFLYVGSKIRLKTALCCPEFKLCIWFDFLKKFLLWGVTFCFYTLYHPCTARLRPVLKQIFAPTEKLAPTQLCWAGRHHWSRRQLAPTRVLKNCPLHPVPLPIHAYISLIWSHGRYHGHGAYKCKLLILPLTASEKARP
jgi:hypothetical protein